MATTQSTAGEIKVFGSALVRVTPDVACAEVRLSRIKSTAKEAFAKANADSKIVHDYLKSFPVDDVCSSRIQLTKVQEYRNGVSKFLGYQASLGYSIVIRDLDRIDELLIGAIDSGADELDGVKFFTSRLKAIREDVRRSALEAAYRKAQIYAEAAGVDVGVVCGIEDMNPEIVSGRSERGMHDSPEGENVDVTKAVDPGAIVVGAAVNVRYRIAEKGSRQPSVSG